MLLMIDNFDSFTYNLVQALGVLGADIRVARNNATSIEAIEGMCPDHIVISPGPCTPNEAGISIEVIQHFVGKVPILGVCLGHQAIGQAFGGDVIRAPEQKHGKTSEIEHDGKGLLAGLPNPFTATRYHSLIVKEETLPDCLVPTAHSIGDNILMGVRHREFPVEGVQYHPESFLSLDGPSILKNFLDQKIPSLK